MAPRKKQIKGYYKNTLHRIIEGDEKEIAQARELFTGLCEFCNLFFDKNRIDQRYCCDKCKNAAAKRRERKKNERNED